MENSFRIFVLGGKKNNNIYKIKIKIIKKKCRGKSLFNFGKRELEIAQWLDLRKQTNQVMFAPKEKEISSTFQLKTNEELAFCGNQHLQLIGHVLSPLVFLPLFYFEFQLTKGYYANDCLIIKVPVLLVHSSIDFFVELLDEKTNKKRKMILLTQGEGKGPFDLPCFHTEAVSNWIMHTWKLKRIGLSNRKLVSFGIRARAVEWVDARVGGVSWYEENQAEEECGVCDVVARKEEGGLYLSWKCILHGCNGNKCWEHVSIYTNETNRFLQYAFKNETMLSMANIDCESIVLESVNYKWERKRMIINI